MKLDARSANIGDGRRAFENRPEGQPCMRITGKGPDSAKATISTPGRFPIKRRLNRAQVLDAARVLCDVSGVDALSIKQLAATLKIQPPSVYAHFGGLTELRRELALSGYRAITTQMHGAAEGLAGTEALLALGHAYLDFIRTSPGLYSAIVAAPNPQDSELWAAGRMWLAPFERVLESLGLSEDDVVHALRGIRSIVHGFGMLEIHGSFRTTVDRDTSFRRVLQTFVEGLEHHLQNGLKGSGTRAVALAKSARVRPAR